MGADVTSSVTEYQSNGERQMIAISKWSIVLALLAGAVYGQVPSTNDTSDANGNTGMGTGALGGPNPVALTGASNTASGKWSLQNDTSGSENTAVGVEALQANTTGADNTAVGYAALINNSSGSGTPQYGLVAEEVAKVYPEPAIRDENGRIDGVRYDELAPMLLNEMQKGHAIVATLDAQHEADATKIERQARMLDKQAAKIASLEGKFAEVDDLKQQLSAVIQELKAQDHLVAQR